MMGEAIVAKLTETPALVGGRVFPVALPPKPTWPSVTYQEIATIPSETLNRRPTEGLKVVQIDIFAETYAEAKAIGQQVRDRLDGVRLGDRNNQIWPRFTAELDAFETTADVHMVVQTWRVQAPL